MGLKFDGELLTISQYDNPGKPGEYDAFSTTTLHVMDEGRITELRVGRDFPGQQLQALRKAIHDGDRPQVVLDCFASKGRLYATGVREAVAA